ncbi:MAG: polysaccharide biosynthesis protein, partial [Acetobacteraceae bacterium]|nr:polysaccharide biosynthesis protein [Acetobacteraceae bacterium]
MREISPRIFVNVLVDGALAGLAVPLARLIADPATGSVHPLWAIPIGSVSLLVAGIPFRLSSQHWRFAGLDDLLSVAGVS